MSTFMVGEKDNMHINFLRPLYIMISTNSLSNLNRNTYRIFIGVKLKIIRKNFLQNYFLFLSNVFRACMSPTRENPMPLPRLSG